MTDVAATDGGTARPPRIGLLDTLRGVALLAMASYHLSWDLEFFGYLDPGTAETGWLKIYARVIASSFLFLAGFSLVLAQFQTIRWPSFGRRLALIAGAALAISAATFFFMPGEWIFFGILHAIAVFSLLGLLFVRLPLAATVAAAIGLPALIVFNGWIVPGALKSTAFDHPWLYWLGLSQTTPRSNDFVPLFPWFAAFLCGIAVARIAWQRGWLGVLAALGTGGSLPARAGRHSLAIYLVHQPVLIGCVYLLSVAMPPKAVDPVVRYASECQAACVAQGAEAALCIRFCGCVVTELQQKSLFAPLQSGAISADNDERVLQIARECTGSSQ